MLLVLEPGGPVARAVDFGDEGMGHRLPLVLSSREYLRRALGIGHGVGCLVNRRIELPELAGAGDGLGDEEVIDGLGVIHVVGGVVALERERIAAKIRGAAAEG